MKKMFLTLSVAGACALGLVGCGGSSSTEAADIQASVQAEGQEIINESIEEATVDIIQGKDIKEAGKDAIESATTKTKKKAKERVIKKALGQ